MTSMQWLRPEWHETIGSTNTHLLADPRPGRVVVAHHQSAGMGRRGRTWESPPGTGMAISVALPALPGHLGPEALGWVPLTAGMAVVRALQTSRWPVDAALKWPNDVLVPLRGPDDTEPTAGHAPSSDDNVLTQPTASTAGQLHARGRAWGKVCGLLAHVAPTGAVVLGAGINVDHTADQLPVGTATSWRLARGPGSAPLPDGARQAFLDDYLEALADGYHRLGGGDIHGLHAAYRDLCLTLQEQVVVHQPGGERTLGRAFDVDATGSLLVRDGRGATHRFHAGDVEHVRGG